MRDETNRDTLGGKVMFAGSVFVGRKCVVREVGLARGNQHGWIVCWWERNGLPREGNDDGKVM